MIIEQTGVMELLKESTATLHDEAEQHPFQQAMIRARLNLDSYVHYLSQMLAVHAALESALRRHESIPAVRVVARPHHFREQLILEDLAFLAVDPGELLPATKRFLTAMEDSVRRNPISVLGFLYVLEGSTNGTKFIAKSVQRALHLEGTRGTCYLNPHAEKQKDRWAAFKADMSCLEWNEQEMVLLVDAAESMFRGITRISDELMGVLHDAAA